MSACEAYLKKIDFIVFYRTVSGVYLVYSVAKTTKRTKSAGPRMAKTDRFAVRPHLFENKPNRFGNKSDRFLHRRESFDTATDALA